MSWTGSVHTHPCLLLASSNPFASVTCMLFWPSLQHLQPCPGQKQAIPCSARTSQALKAVEAALYNPAPLMPELPQKTWNLKPETLKCRLGQSPQGPHQQAPCTCQTIWTLML